MSLDMFSSLLVIVWRLDLPTQMTHLSSEVVSLAIMLLELPALVLVVSLAS